MVENIEQTGIIPCHFHPQKEAMGACLACAKPLCDECGHWFKGRLYCLNCHANVEFMHAQAEISMPPKSIWNSHPWLFLFFLASGILLSFLGDFLLMMRFMAMGGIAVSLGWLSCVISLPLVRMSTILSRDFKKLVTYIIYFLIVSIPSTALSLALGKSLFMK